MNRSCSSDRLRVSALEQQARCITLSEARDIDGQGQHFEVDFKHIRGWKKVLKFVKNLVTTTPDCYLVVFLDYFWLQTNYFRERYGLDWYVSKVPSLLDSGVRCCYMPHSPEISTSLQSVPDRFSWSFLWSTPLYAVTTKIQLGDRGTHEGQLGRLCSPPFILFVPKQQVVVPMSS